jgi:hypothetical protein
MRRWIIAALAGFSTLFLGALPAYAQQFQTGLAFEYGTTSSAFSLSSPYFTVPYQGNVSGDEVISADVEYLLARGLPLDVGVAFKGSFAFSEWDLGSPGVYDVYGNYYYPDDILIGATWWALAALGTAHVHLGRFATLDGAVGYGPYGYLNVNYWDSAGLTAGPIVQGGGFFPPNAWSVDWSAGLSFGFFRRASLGLDLGMMGPDFVAGFSMNFRS